MAADNSEIQMQVLEELLAEMRGRIGDKMKSKLSAVNEPMESAPVEEASDMEESSEPPPLTEDDELRKRFGR